MDEIVEERTAELQRRRYADNNFFHYGRNADFKLSFTRAPKEVFAPYSTGPAFTDAGSFQSRKYFSRPDYIIQNKTNGAMQIRGQLPRIRVQKILN